MSDAEIEQAIRDAQQYAARDGIRRSLFEVNSDAEKAIADAQKAMDKAKKAMPKEEKKQIKAEISRLRKLMADEKPDRMTEGDVAQIRDAVFLLRTYTEKYIL